MSEASKEQPWTWTRYLDWESRQPHRYELVDGRVYAMGGGTSAHDIIGNNVRSSLRQQLRGKPCRVQGPGFKVKAGENGRYPDALIDCGPFNPEALFASEPVAVFEVLSKSTEWFDQTLKLRDYDAGSCIGLYALISQTEAKVIIYTRDQTGRFGPQTMQVLHGTATSIDLPNLNIALPTSEIYEGLGFDAGT